MSDAFDSGAQAGKDINKQAIDCPYPPTDDTGQRSEWLKGFSSTRSEASFGSDPARIGEAGEPDNAGPPITHAMHEG